MDKQGLRLSNIGRANSIFIRKTGRGIIHRLTGGIQDFLKGEQQGDWSAQILKDTEDTVQIGTSRKRMVEDLCKDTER